MKTRLPWVSLTLLCLGYVTSANAQLIYNFNALALPSMSSGGKGGEYATGKIKMTTGATTDTLEMWIHGVTAPGSPANVKPAIFGFGFNYDTTKWTETSTGFSDTLALTDVYGATIYPTPTGSTVAVNPTSFPWLNAFNTNLGNFDVGAGKTSASGSVAANANIGSADVYLKFNFTRIGTPTFNEATFFRTATYGSGSADFAFEFKEMGASSERFIALATIETDAVVPFEPVPEPSTYGIFGSAALVALGVVHRQRRARLAAA